MPTLRNVTAFIGTAAAASAFGLAALVTAGNAGATSIDDTYISVLKDQGIEAPSTAEAVGMAHKVCSMIDHGNDLVDAVSAVSDATGLQMEDSAFIVGASVASYCPQYSSMIA
jgi:hypothetical protein